MGFLGKLKSGAQAVLRLVGLAAKEVKEAIPEQAIQDTFDELKDIAIIEVGRVIQSLNNGSFDLHGAIADLQTLCAPLEKSWAKRITGLSVEQIITSYDIDDIVTLLERARITNTILQRVGPDGILPATSIINFAITTALMILNADYIAESFKR
jgi:hypothetical protein